MTTIYNYHPSTGELISECVADVSPLEPEVILLPAFSTTIAPPAVPADRVAVFDGEAWALVQDFRGIVYWLGDSSFTISVLGELPPADATGAAPVPTLTEIKSRLMSAVDDAISAIYIRFTRFEAEYVQREAAARAFVASGYQGDAGVWVMAFANNIGMSSAQAADVIISQADTLRAALVQLGAQRMRKYGIAAAETAEASQAVYDDITGQVAAIAATL